MIVPAGEYKRAIVAEMRTGDAASESVQLVWYANGVGPVKIVTKTTSGTLTWELEKVLDVLPFAFHKSGDVKVATDAERQEPPVAKIRNADEDAGIICFTSGLMEDGRPYWVYLAVKPNKYQEFKKLTDEGKGMTFSDYGTVVAGGFGKEVPASVKQEMKEKYGFEDLSQRDLTKQFYEAQAFFVQQQESEHIADIVEMLKKKQGR